MNRFAWLALALFVVPAGCGGGDTPAAGDANVVDGSIDGASHDAATSDAGHDAAVGPHEAGADAPLDVGGSIDVGTDALGACATVTCTASDACHTIGTCDPATGTCSTPTAADGTSCTLASGAGFCVGGTCLATCTDAHRDGTETDVDCGGDVCPGCAVGHTCNVDGDCGSHVCNGAMQCVMPTCTDARRDGTETDVDCGGGVCPGCTIGHACQGDADCGTGVCNAAMQCAMPTCSDARRDGAETDVDCGGATCPHCVVGRRCMVASDCVSAACDVLSATCVASQCSDHSRDGSESDVDCGGGTCPACGTGLGCFVDSDCSTNACSTVTLTCVTSQCADSHADGAETDVDCGGAVCPRCALNKRCTTDGDCTSSACDAISRLCIASQCADHRQDGAETDVDCGGGTCTSCAVGQRCNVNFDCASGHTCSVAHLCL